MTITKIGMWIKRVRNNFSRNSFFIINNYNNYYFGMIEPLKLFNQHKKGLIFFSLDASIEPRKGPIGRSNRE